MSASAPNESDDLPDFMSDSFLAQLSDVRPGLNSTIGKAKRLHQPSVQQTANHGKRPSRIEKQREKQAKAAEAFQEALAKPVFAETYEAGHSATVRSMMSKMGYEHGRGLGKSGQGRLEPIPLSLKSGRSGLGHLSSVALNRKRSAGGSSSTGTETAAAESADFRKRMSAKFARADVGADLARAQRACKRLDIGWPSDEDDQEPSHCCTITNEPPARWFWPPDEENDDSQSEDDANPDELPSPPSSEEKLQLIVDRLRQLYYYCMWCGQLFDSEEDLMAGCPGSERADHDHGG